MLKKFFLNVLTSFVGAWIAIALFGVVAFFVIIGIGVKLGAGDDDAEKIGKHSVLVINLNGSIEEREQDPQVDYMALLNGGIERPQTLRSLVKAIEEAKRNKAIKAIYIKCNGVSASPATLNALRAVLSDFKESDKKIVSYGDSYSSADYYVASVADSLIMNPRGMVGLKGLGSTNFYFKDLLDKVGVGVQVVKVGTFKSAVEPYILNDMSEPARAQLDTLFGYMWNVMTENMSESRTQLNPGKINSMVDSFMFTLPATDILDSGFVDRLEYERKVDDLIASMIGTEKKKVTFVSVPTLVGDNSQEGYGSSRRIAVVYACGEIADGAGKSVIDYKWLVPLITELAEDDDVKGMVLRVNSPGGSAFGSEQIGEALDYFQSKGKPLAVSMGDYAASGGYWISCCADRIFADPLTITGSIGIFALIPNAERLAKMIGVHPQEVSTNPGASFPTLFSPMNPAQQAAMQKNVEYGYDTFVARVARGRKMSEEKVRCIGEGRVWSAGKALEIGLVDQMGNLDDAIEWVAGEAGLDDSYSTAVYPKKETGIWDYLPSDFQVRLGRMIEMNAGDVFDKAALRVAMDIITRHPVQARMPYFDVRLGGEDVVMTSVSESKDAVTAGQ